MTKKYYPEVSANPDFPKIEEKIISFWKKDAVFEKSVSEHPAKIDNKNNEFVFYDGPPFANGLPHYGHLLTGFVKDIYPNCGVSRDIDCDKTGSIKLMNSLGIDSSKVMSCVDTEGDVLIQEHSQLASELGVTGSPTLVINGVKSNAARTSEAYKQAVCNAFNTAPAECSTTLDSSATTTAGNC